MLWVVYNILFALGFTFMMPRFLWRMWKRGGYRRGFMQRLGVYDEKLLARIRERPRIWIHAVSVGEIFVAMEFVKEWRKRRPDAAFVMTTTTSTAYRVGGRLLHAEDVLLYFPVDFPSVVKKVLKILRPLALVLTECELWPNVIRYTHERGIPVFLINGRISRNSHAGYKTARVFIRQTLAAMDLLCVQSGMDRDHLVDLGADPARVRIMGTAKYDVAQLNPAGIEKAEKILRAAGVPADVSIVVGGSTWPGEEAILLDIQKRLKVAGMRMTLVLVPRHVERRYEVEAEIEERDMSFTRRSEIDLAAEGGSFCPDVVLVDTTGELRDFYAKASVIFVGKSLTARGGQNIIEPALYGKPIIVGPYTENFELVMDDFLKEDAILRVINAACLESSLMLLLKDEAARARYGERARQVVEKKRGAIRASLDLIEPLVPKAP